MFSKQELKILIISLGRKYLFPDFTNKLTWFVVTVGGAIILTTTAFWQIFFNWIIETFNINSASYFTLAELESSNSEYIIGFLLIVFALFHNIAHRYIIYKTGDIAAAEAKEQAAVDRMLFERFLAEFPSRSKSVILLKEHDFGNSYHGESTEEIGRFVDTWNTAETHFLDSELETVRKELYNGMHEFIYKLAGYSGYINTGPMQSVVPDAYRDAWELPEFIDKRIKELNDKATECYELHQKFIILGRCKLKC